MHFSPLHTDFGVEVHGADLRRITAEDGYPAIRAAFEEHSLLLFRGQHLEDEAHLLLGALFGPIEDRAMGQLGPKPRMDNVTNRLPGDTIAPLDSFHTLNLLANQLWHTDSTFLPVPALANILAARVLSSTGGETEFASTRAAWRRMPEGLKAQLRDAVLVHRHAYSRAKVSLELSRQERSTRWKDQRWRAVWRNPVNGKEALYIASHACAVVGMPDAEGQVLIDEAINFATAPGTVYTHVWRPGDVLIWDERAILHRGRPWPYAEERTLASICVSARDIDGLNRMRP
jgi:alpha-ketoglutarate-dependent 2,4-dichlorophenoxyacetate dioxygenase